VFTGLIRHRGSLARREGSRLTIATPTLTNIRHGDSIAVNGVCLTAAELGDGVFTADLLEATLRDTTLGSLPEGSLLNLEPALLAGEPLGGHLVQGHVDGVTKLLSRKALANEDWRYEFALPAWLRPNIVPKGSICVDGVSLTVQELGAESFTVQLIPVTWSATNLGQLEPGAQVNLEADLIVKTVSTLLAQRLAQLEPGTGNLTELWQSN
jgi:riboflavin synthase